MFIQIKKKYNIITFQIKNLIKILQTKTFTLICVKIHRSVKKKLGIVGNIDRLYSNETLSSDVLS